MSQFFLFLLTLFIACSIGLCRNSSSQVNTCFTWFFSSDSMECKHFLYVSFFFCSSLSSYFSCSLFLYFAPFLNFSTICPAEFLLPTIGLSLLSALTFSSVASPFSPQHFHSTFFSPFFPQAEFQSWLSLQNKLLFVLTLQPGAVSGILCSGGQIWAAVL